MADGSVLEVMPNDVYDIPPGHDGFSVGPEPFRAINWAGARTWYSTLPYTQGGGGKVSGQCRKSDGSA